MLFYSKPITKPVLLFILGISVFILSACGNLGEPPEPVTIKFSYPSDVMHYYEDLVTEFQAQNQDIVIELDSVYPSEMSAQAESNQDGPAPSSGLEAWDPAATDVFVTTQYDLSTLQAQNAILSLNPFIGKDSSFDAADYYPGTLDSLTHNNETWGVPVGSNMFVLYFNKSLFDKAGIPYPQSGWTWEELIEASYEITEPDAVPTPIYGYSPIDGLLDSIALIGSFGGSIFDDIKHPTRVTFDDPLVIEALEFYADLFHTHEVAPTPSIAGQNYASQFPLYEGARRGRTGMWILQFSDRGGLSGFGKWRFDWGMAPLPRGKVQNVPFFTETMYVISAASEHPEQSWAWISFLSQQQPQTTLPARRSLVESSDFEAQVGADNANVVRSSIPFAAIIPLYNWSDFEDRLGYFFQGVYNIMEGTATPQEAMDQAQEEATRQ